MPKPKTISLTSDEIHAIIRALNSQFALLVQTTGNDEEYPLAEMDLVDDVIEKLREHQ